MSRRGVVYGPHALQKRQAAYQMRHQMTEEEEALWERLRANRLGGLHFRRQQVIEGFIVDFYCHAAGLVVEVDGDVHDRQPGHDAERDACLTGLGLRVLRFRNERLLNEIDAVLETILAVAYPPPPSPVGRGARG